jgi:hypothetical protein
MRQKRTKFFVLLVCTIAWPLFGQTNEVDVGPAYSDFKLTLTSGYREEAVGPLYYSQQSEAQTQWAFPPFFCVTKTADVDWSEFDFLYPLLTYRRFGPEYRLQLVEFISFSGGQSSVTNAEKIFTFFPFYFQQRGPDTNLNYTAVAPFYGHLINRLFRDDIKFVLFPVYSETRKRGVVTDNYLYPIVDVRRGDHLSGWQVWPLVGMEHKAPTYRTNMLDETETVGGHDNFFALWPFYFKDRGGIGTTNEDHSLTVVPFYNHFESKLREQTSYGWPLGYNIIDDREKKYVEHDVLWPLFITAHGSKTETRVFPFFSRAKNASLESDFYLWPVYKFNRLNAAPLERTRTRILFFLYSDITETNHSSGDWTHREDFWPFYTCRRDIDGNRRFQALAVLEPFFPNNRAITREYSQVWSFWRSEHNKKTGAASQSLLWNLYRREETPRSKNFSLLFGLFQYQSGAEGRRWRVCYVTVGKKKAPVPAP